MHHTYSDTDKDPHSPHFFRDIWQMMWHTAVIFRNFVKGKNLPSPEFTKEYLPKWDKLDKLGNHFLTRVFFAAIYITVYILFAPNAWYFLLLPVHFFMGPVQGAIVNWCGHKYGYSNYDNNDHSKNSSPWGILLMGELFQNNHHHQKNNANFARRWFEFDVTYLIMRLLNKARIIRLIPAVVPAVTNNRMPHKHTAGSAL
jgi:stearoyl-CoA desaturase (delta-9 desaturase)